MKLVEIMRRVGSLMFLFMWIPFICIFLGMAEEMGSLGQRFVGWVDPYLPGLLAIKPSGASTLTEVSTTIVIGLSILSMALIFGSPLLASMQNRRLIRNGQRADAKIVSMQQTGTYINNNPVVRFMLEVERPDGRPFHAEAERLVRLVELGSLQPGASVQVRYDPDSLEVAIVEE